MERLGYGDDGSDYRTRGGPEWVTLLSAKAIQVRWAVIVTLGRVVVEAETAEAARDKVERKGYIVLEVNRDNSSQALSF